MESRIFEVHVSSHGCYHGDILINDIDLIYENVSMVTTLKYTHLQCCYLGDILINQVNVISE